MNDDVSYDLVSRPRRLRSTPAMRRFVAETRVDPSDLIPVSYTHLTLPTIYSV